MSPRITGEEAAEILRDLARGREDGNGGDVWPLYDRAEDAMAAVVALTSALSDETHRADAAEMQRFDAEHAAEHWRESHDIEHTRADAAEAECARLRRRMDHATPWGVSDPPTDDEMHALRLRWAFGPERYQADADALIAAVIALRSERDAARAEADALRAIVEGGRARR